MCKCFPCGAWHSYALASNASSNAKSSAWVRQTIWKCHQTLKPLVVTMMMPRGVMRKQEAGTWIARQDSRLPKLRIESSWPRSFEMTFLLEYYVGTPTGRRTKARETCLEIWHKRLSSAGANSKYHPLATSNEHWGHEPSNQLQSHTITCASTLYSSRVLEYSGHCSLTTVGTRYYSTIVPVLILSFSGELLHSTRSTIVRSVLGVHLY